MPTSTIYRHEHRTDRSPRSPASEKEYQTDYMRVRIAARCRMPKHIALPTRPPTARRRDAAKERKGQSDVQNSLISYQIGRPFGSRRGHSRPPKCEVYNCHISDNPLRAPKVRYGSNPTCEPGHDG